MSALVYTDGTDAQLMRALERILLTKDTPAYLTSAAFAWLMGVGRTDADLAAALWRYTHTKSAPRYLVIAANRWMAPR